MSTRSTAAGAGLPRESGAGRYRTAQEFVADELRRSILAGELPTGERLMQSQIADQFGFSITPVREAFRDLAAEGLVRLSPNRGVEVREASRTELSEIYQLRVLYEPLATAWAAERMTDDVIAEAKRLLGLMEIARDGAELAELNRRLHLVLLSACGHERMTTMLTNLVNVSAMYVAQHYLSGMPARQRMQLEDHGEIIAACEARDPERAYASALRHVCRIYDDEHPTRSMEPEGFADRWLPPEIRAALAGVEGIHPRVAATERPEPAAPPSTKPDRA